MKPTALLLCSVAMLAIPADAGACLVDDTVRLTSARRPVLYAVGATPGTRVEVRVPYGGHPLPHVARRLAGPGGADVRRLELTTEARDVEVAVDGQSGRRYSIAETDIDHGHWLFVDALFADGTEREVAWARRDGIRSCDRASWPRPEPAAVAADRATHGNAGDVAFRTIAVLAAVVLVAAAARAVRARAAMVP